MGAWPAAPVPVKRRPPSEHAWPFLARLPFPPPLPYLACLLDACAPVFCRYTAIGTHLVVSGAFIGGLYAAISWGVDVAALLENVPLLNRIPGAGG